MMRCRTVIGAAIAGAALTAVPADAIEELRIDAGADQVVRVNAPVFLVGSVSKSASIGWSRQEGPGEVTFENRHSATTRASFSAPGEYTLMLGGFDGYVAYDTVRIVVGP